MGSMAIFLAVAAVVLLFRLFIFLSGLIGIQGWSSVSKQVRQVSTSLDATKGHLTQRLDKLESKVDELSEMLKDTRNEVQLAIFKITTAQKQFDIESKRLSDMEARIERYDAKQDIVLDGIVYLCNCVEGAEDGIRAKHFQEARNKLEPASRPSSTFSMNKTANQEGLKFFAASMEIGETENYKPNLHKDLDEPTKTTPEAAIFPLRWISSWKK